MRLRKAASDSVHSIEETMKKHMVLAALCGAILSTAQAQSTVQIYGVIDLNLTREDNGVGKVTKLDQGLLSSNRLGWLGKEELGNGWTAQFQLESGFFPDSGSWDSTKAFNRQSWVGLVNKDLGGWRFGRIRTLLYQNAWEYLDATGNSLSPASFRLFNFFGNRTDNIVEYSWSNNSFKTAVQYGLGEVAGNSRAGRTMAEMAAYDIDRLKLLIVNHRVWDATGNDSARATTFGGNYDFGAMRLYLAYAINKGFGTLDTRDSLVGINLPLGPGKFMAQYVRKRDLVNPNGGARLYGVAYTYDLSKRTSLYTSTAKLDNGPAASFMAGGPGKAWTQLAAGITHRF
jgi:predicted porin